MHENVASERMVAGLLPLLLVLCIGAGLATFKIQVIGFSPNSDYNGYLETAQLFRTVPGAVALPARILKPLNPLVVGAEESVMTPATAFATQVIVFYFLFLLACYFFGRAFGLSREQSAFLSLLLGGSYPALKYGIDLYTETGAWFFYIASLALTLRYLRAPTSRLVLMNTAVITVGFLWKEYSIVSAIVFGSALLCHPALPWRTRVESFLTFSGLFLAVNLAWQAYIYITYQYTYLSWYTMGGVGGFKTEFTIRNLVKSVGALLGLAWLLVPFGMLRSPGLAHWQKRFLVIAIPASLLAFAWGNVSSRLFFVMAPAFALLALLPLARIQNPYLRYGMLTLILVGNMAWLVLSKK